MIKSLIKQVRQTDKMRPNKTEDGTEITCDDSKSIGLRKILFMPWNTFPVDFYAFPDEIISLFQLSQTCQNLPKLA